MTAAPVTDAPAAGDPTATSTTATTSDAPPAKKPPEPWTPQKVREWNAYYDKYVALGVLLLVFLGSFNKLANPSVWSHLQAGRELSTSFAPTVDRFSITESGHRWVNVSWLSDLIHYEVFQLGASFARPSEVAPANPAAEAPEIRELRRREAAKSEQAGATAIIGLDATIRMLTVLVIFFTLRRGPGLWWACVVATFAFGMFPTGDVSRQFDNKLFAGGLGGPAAVDSWTWGQLFLAIEILCLSRAFGLGKTRALYALVPLFVLWANVDESFLLGLLAFGATILGAALTKSPRKGEIGPEGPRFVLRPAAIVLGICALACLANPSIALVYPAALSSMAPTLGWFAGPLTPEYLSIFGPSFTTTNPPGEVRAFQITYAIAVLVGFASFALNVGRVSLSRLFLYTIAAAAWGLTLHYRAAFALAMLAVVAKNGQDWYQRQFGVEGKLGAGWAVWSVGGRAATIAGVFLMIVLIITRQGFQGAGTQFGGGFEPADFPFEAADAVLDATFPGNVLNTTLKQGDAIVWRAYPQRKTFIDSRRHVYSPGVSAEYEDVQKAIRDDDPAVWRPILDKYSISAVLFDKERSRRTILALKTNPNWVRIYDDGANALYGRKDAKDPADLAYFESHKLDAPSLVFKFPTPLPSPSTEGIPTRTTGIDRIYKTRSGARPQPHTVAALGWLTPEDRAADVPAIPDPARCFCAIREARLALALRVDDSAAYRVLADAYFALLVQESALLKGLEPNAKNLDAVARTTPEYGLLALRAEQYTTALAFASMTAAAGATEAELKDLAALEERLAQALQSVGAADLARDRYQAVSDAIGRFLPLEAAQSLAQEVQRLTQGVDKVREQVGRMGIESGLNPLERSRYAAGNGAIGLAIEILEEARQNGVAANLVKPPLLDLLCLTGQADRALSLWTSANTADPALADGPGTAALRQARVFLLVGNYRDAIVMMLRETLPSIRRQNIDLAPSAARSLLTGGLEAAYKSFRELPESVEKQSVYEFQTALMAIEGGQPAKVAVEALTNSLKLVPNSPYRPIIAYYLTQYGEPVPAATTAPKSFLLRPDDSAPAPTPDPAKP